MHQALSIFLRDVRTFFVVPTAGIIAAIFTLVCSIIFVGQVFVPNGVASMQPVFNGASWLLIILCPAITMRLVAEERRVGSWQLTLASPASALSIIKGKFWAAWLLLICLLLTTLPLVIVLMMYASVDIGAVLSGYLGLLLFGGAVLSTGLMVSACTNSQTVAYLVTTFFWLTVSLVAKALPQYVPSAYSSWFFYIDPELRVSKFSIGLIDTANIVYFFVIIKAFGWLAMLAVRNTRQGVIPVFRLIASCVLLLACVISFNVISLQESVRWRFDATGSQAYTLSEQTKTLIREIESPYQITVLLDETQASRSSVEQIDEVLRRIKQQSDWIAVNRINPSHPEAIAEYELLIRQLRERYAAEMAECESVIDSSIETFRSLQLFAASMSSVAETLHQATINQDEQTTLQTLTSSLALLAQEGGLILDEVDKAQLVDVNAPLPRLSFARDILLTATSRWARELAEVAWWLRANRSEEIAEFCMRESIAFEEMARSLKDTESQLLRLGDIEVGLLATQLQSGEGAILLSQERAAMIPARLLFPEKQVETTVAADRRFRGEQIISSAMRKLNSDATPKVVFVHGEQGSLFGVRPNNADLLSAKTLLDSARFEVLEWMPHQEAMPEIRSDHVAWVVIPPAARAGLEPTPTELGLIETTRSLIASGANVMVNLQPSLLPKYGQKDPWANLVHQLGVNAETSKVVLEQVATGPNQFDIHRSQTLHNTIGESLIARALNGRAMFFPLPIEVQGGENVYEILPSTDRWLDDAWANESITKIDQEPIAMPVPVVSLVESGSGAGQQRAIVVGSGGWLFSWALERGTQLGGQNVMMANPGNSEFLLSSVEWLSNLDEWIAAGPIGNQIGRISGLSANAHVYWSIGLVFGIPLEFLASVFLLRKWRYAA